MKSVYIHIPFCKSICSYCDFCKCLYDEVWASEYLLHLEKEIESTYDNSLIDTIYIGGGTPSSLSIKNITTLLDIIKNNIDMSNVKEFTYECNINDIDEEKLILLKKYGVNRLSIGVESFDKNNLKYLNRKHTKKEIFNNIKLAKNYFNNISIDLIYAIPIESMRILKKDIRLALRLGVNHISTYSLILEDNTILKIRNTKSVSEELDSKMYNYICKKLTRKGYNHYEVSNFSIPGFESNHNLKYWNNQEYFGFGLGSHGYVDGIRYENTRSFNTYLSDNYRLNELILSKREDMENEVILGLRKLEGIDIKEFFNKYNVNIQDEFNITSLIKEKLLILDGSMLRINGKYIYIMNSIINKVLEGGR